MVVTQIYAPEPKHYHCCEATTNHMPGHSLVKNEPGTNDGVAVVAEEEDDREEGEIVDEFEMIISSEDEEFKLRARIQQLEENNKDVEKMDMLSANLANQYNYHPKAAPRYTRYQKHVSPVYVLSDVSSLSESEYEPQRKYRSKNKLRRLESKKHDIGSADYRRHPNPRRLKQRLKRRSSQNHHNHHYGHRQDVVLLDTLCNSVTDDEICEYDLNDEEEDDVEDLERLKLSRDKLRVALAREERQELVSQYKMSLKERLQFRHRKSPANFKQEADLIQLPDLSQEEQGEEHVEQQHQHQPRDEDPAELKLRLIALKSAILKKHLARKKRDAERAYSPTDMINRVHPSINNDCDTDDLMEISPAASPERALSPIHQQVDTKPVDMDLADTDSDDQHQRSWNTWANNWNSLETAGGSWRCFMPNNSLPPVSMPIVIDEEEEVAPQYVDEDDEIPPPPPPFHIPQMHLEDDDARDALHLAVEHSNQDSSTDIQSISMDNSLTRKSEESSEDEAGALRAMLLSNLRPTKMVTPPPAPPPPPPPPPPASIEEEEDDPEELRSLLLSSIASKKKNLPQLLEEDRLSPDILKNAVRRFLPPQEAPPDEPVVPLPVPAPLPEPELTLPLQPTPPPPSLKIIKIVKPNKVINRKTATKRKITSEKLPSTLMLKESNAPLHNHNSASNTRLITTLDPSSIKVNRLIISLAAESSAGSDDELELKSCFTSYANYRDNASPFSLALGSASGSTTRSNTPNSEILEQITPNNNPNLRRTVINEYFEKKLDDFLKQARSKVPTLSPLAAENGISEGEKSQPAVEKEKEKEEEEKKATNEVVSAPPDAATTTAAVVKPQSKTTPVAVRHLPVASQKEYLRLIERMQLLEQKKIKAAKKVKTTSSTTTTATTGTVTVTSTAKSTIATSTSVAASAPAVKPLASNPIKPPATTKVVRKISKLVAKTPANSPATTTAAKENKSSNTAAATVPVEPSTSRKAELKTPSKESRLKAFENSFTKIGCSMISNLDKSLQMVEEARQSKIARLRCSQRLKELFAEMQSVKQAVKQEEAKLSRIQPEIQASHEIIISLKQKRNKLFNAAMDLGKGLRGDDYRLKDEGKPDIIRKSSHLTKEIRLYNSIRKYEDVVRLVDQENEQELPPPPPAESQPIPDNQPQVEAVDKETVQEIETPGPFTVSFMRQLREEQEVGPQKESYLNEYRTPMSRNYNSQLDVHATMCPFDLMGRCEDADCTYLHLSRAAEAVQTPAASQ